MGPLKIANCIDSVGPNSKVGDSVIEGRFVVAHFSFTLLLEEDEYGLMVQPSHAPHHTTTHTCHVTVAR